MATETGIRGKTVPRGKARFEMAREGETLSVHLDRKGFRRLLDTLERLAETGEPQTFEKSGRAGSGEGRAPLEKLVFHIEGDR